MKFLRQRREEEGATAVLVALLAIVIFGTAALAVDFSSLAMERQKLHDHIDSAAHAGAFMLPGDPAGARNAARSIAQAQDSAIDPDVELFCVVASLGASHQPNLAQIPSTCDPGGSAPYPGVRCNDVICSIPCPRSASYNSTAKCNTVRAEENKTVDFGFGDIIGTPTGQTGSVASAACKGSCGSEAPNPMDIVVMADRTPSMLAPDRRGMIDGIRSMLTTMDPSLHYVAFGVLHKSRTASGCATANTPALSPAPTRDDTSWRAGAQVGTWMPVPFSNNYLNGDGTAVNGTSALGRALTCVYSQSDDGAFGTQLASAMKGAARYLVGLDSNNLGSLPARPGTAKKVLIFETDGSPDETWRGGSTSLTNNGDVAAGWQALTGGSNGSDANGVAGCDNMVAVANNAKARGITVITIGFGAATTHGCARRDSPNPQVAPYTRDKLAAAASPHPGTGAASTASACNTAASRTAENTDGDYYFCATSGSELADIFRRAIAQVTDSIKLIRLP